MRTLILNADGLPIKVEHWKKAFKLVHKGKAEVVSYHDSTIRSGTGEFLVPSVVRRKKLIKFKHLRVPLKKYNVLLRDRHKCQYCGKYANTVDHVVPKVILKDKKLFDTWTNMVACCWSCNSRKGEQTWQPVKPPKEPTRAELINTDEFYK